MDPLTFRQLLTPYGQEVLQAAVALQPKEPDFLSLFTALAKHYPADLARTALEVAIYRRKAQVKFPFADRMYFTRDALEQASSYEVSSYRAQRYRPFERIADLGCSLGADTLSLVQAVMGLVVGLDRDELRLNMAQANLAALDLAERACFVQADLTRPLPFCEAASLALFFDPARRTKGRRVFSVRQYAGQTHLNFPSGQSQPKP